MKIRENKKQIENKSRNIIVIMNMRIEKKIYRLIFSNKRKNNVKKLKNNIETLENKIKAVEEQIPDINQETTETIKLYDKYFISSLPTYGSSNANINLNL